MAKARTKKAPAKTVKSQIKKRAIKKSVKAHSARPVGDSQVLEAELDQQEDLNFKDNNIDVESSRPQTRNAQTSTRNNKDSEFRRTDEFQEDRTEGAAKSSRRNQNADANVRGSATPDTRRLNANEERENDETSWDVTDENIDHQTGIAAKDDESNARFNHQRRRDSQIDVNVGRRNALAGNLRQGRPHRQATSRSHK